MNDYWNYLAHSEMKEREGHKYYARVIVGTDRNGRVQYRYFYDAREYGAWKTRQQKSNKSDNHGPFNEVSTKKAESGRTNIITGWNSNGKLPSKNELADVRKMTPTKLKNGESSLRKGVRGVDTPEKTIFGTKKQGATGSIRTISVKTVKNKSKKTIRERGKEMIARLFAKRK